MIACYTPPQLAQLVPTPAQALWGIERLNKGYLGPTARVRRSSDSTTVEAYSAKDITTFCAGTHGFVVQLYDQTGNGRHLSQVTTAYQPKVHDSSTGLYFGGGKTPCVQFLKANTTFLSRNDKCGFPNGSPAITTAFYAASWGNTAPPNPCLWGLGDFLTDVPPAGWNWYIGHPSGGYFISTRLAGRNWTQSVDPGTNRSHFVARKAADVTSSSWTLRQNKTTLTVSGTTDGALVFATTGNPISVWGNAPPLQQPADSLGGLLGHWNANISDGELDALEQVLERMRL